MIEIGIVGKPNVGKSTFFNAITSGNAQVAGYPFTTIEPNRGVGYARTKCVCTELGVKDAPRNSMCVLGERFIPVSIIDVAGLVPKAHEGRGLGNKFLDDLRQAQVLIHVVDATGATDAEGNIIGKGERDPGDDIRFLEEEVNLWFFEILKKNWSKIARKAEAEKKDLIEALAEAFGGIGVKETHVAVAIRESALEGKKPTFWKERELKEVSLSLFKASRKMIIAANKADEGNALENIEKLKQEFPNLPIVPASAMSELILKNLASKGAIKYFPGDSSFEVVDEAKIQEKEKRALEIVKKNVLEKFKSTGVMECVNRAVFELLDMITVFPVEDEHKYSDRQGNVLPDALLLRRDSTPKELAAKIHSDLAEHYIGSLDARTKRMVGKDYKLKDKDVIKILFRA